MPLVMLHGVNTRDGDDYRRAVQQQQTLFAGISLRGLATNPAVTHPYWGDIAAAPRWKNASIPEGRYESFGAEDHVVSILEEAADTWPEENPLLALVEDGLPNVIDILWTLIPDNRASPELAELGAKAVAYAELHPRPQWLAQATNDQQFLTQLALNIDAWDPSTASSTTAGTTWESFGLTDVWDRVREGAGRLVGLPGRVAGSTVVAATRSKIHETLSLFVGDVMVYLDTRGTESAPGPIPSLVIEALETATQAKTVDDPHLVIVGHSMGGNILYDVLTHYRPDLAVDALITVGSQVAVLEELKVYHVSLDSIPSHPGERVPKPPNVRAWINVFDKQDILSFVTAPVFESTTDFEYSTGASAIGAHGSYFKRPSFHRRLNERLKEALTP